jgi:hypothetical protein
VNFVLENATLGEWHVVHVAVKWLDGGRWHERQFDPETWRYTVFLKGTLGEWHDAHDEPKCPDGA